MKDVIGIGSPFVDYFFEVDAAFLQEVSLAPEDSRAISPQEFETIFSQKKILAKSGGGSTAITLAVLTSLGVKTGYTGIIGDDADGAFWTQQLSGVELVVERKGDTAQSACLLSNKRKNRSFLYTQNKKENDFFDTVDISYITNTKILHITPFYTNYEFTFQKLISLVSQVENPLLSFCPAIVYTSLGLQTLRPILEKTHIVFFSQEELALLFADKEKGSKELVRYGPEIVICTLGEKGVMVTTKEKQFVVPTKPVKNIVDSTGAGDAFAAGFLTGLLQKQSLEDCAKMGNHIAGKSLTDFGITWLKKQ